MKQRGLFDPAEPAPDPVAREIAELRKTLAQRLRAYHDATGEARREIDLAIRAARARLQHLEDVRRRQEAVRAQYAPPPPPPPPPPPRRRLRALPKVHDGKHLATGEKD